jgi:hypothetical protein
VKRLGELYRPQARRLGCRAARIWGRAIMMLKNSSAFMGNVSIEFNSAALLAMYSWINAAPILLSQCSED